jgi:RNA polymerase sigma factor (sigma-70 family)
MNVHVSYKGGKTPDVEKEINQQIEKLQKRLQVFKPELIHLHGNVDPNTAREGCHVSLNLRLPSGQMAASSTAPDLRAAVKGAFDDLLEQVLKHKDNLRSEWKWPRRQRGDRARPQPQVPFEETLAAVQPATITESDITSYININLYRLIRYVDRELRYREANGQIEPDQVSREEVINEAIATAMDNGVEKPEKLSLEPWLYRLALRSIDLLSSRYERQDNAVPLEQRVRRSNRGESDESQLQYHQPDETFSEQDNIPNRGISTPEEIAASDEMIDMVEAALLGAKREDREAFLLFAVEGFTPEEIAVIGDRSVDQVRASIHGAREHLRKTLPMPNEFKDKLLEQTKIA